MKDYKKFYIIEETDENGHMKFYGKRDYCTYNEIICEGALDLTDELTVNRISAFAYKNKECAKRNIPIIQKTHEREYEYNAIKCEYTVSEVTVCI